MKDILETLTTAGTFTSLLSILEKAGLTDMLRDAGPFTLFAPNDNAFKRLEIDELSSDLEKLISTLSYHIVSGKFTAAAISRDESLTTSNGKSLTIKTEEGVQVIDNARYIKTDIECTNGFIHIIDNVFLPQLSGWYCSCC